MENACKVEFFVVSDGEAFQGKKRVSGGILNSEEGKIELAFEDHLFAGKEVGYGHWVCEDQLKNFEGCMSLHKTPGSKTLEGYYEGSKKGGGRLKAFIRVHL